MSLVTPTATIEEDGFVWARQLVGPEQIAELIAAVATVSADSTHAGVRDLLSRCPAVAKFAASQAVARWVNPILGENSCQRPVNSGGIESILPPSPSPRPSPSGRGSHSFPSSERSERPASTDHGVRFSLSTGERAGVRGNDALSNPINGPTKRESFVVRGLLFDKTPEANWRVAWHQDVTIAVREQRPVPGFGPWSVKDGIPHTHAPAGLLERMVTLRLHLDDCDESNGALRVLTGSHRSGKLDAKAIEEWKTQGPVEPCLAQAGDALFMRPLLLHASSPADSPRHRRVIHLEFAVDELPAGLAWAERISE